MSGLKATIVISGPVGIGKTVVAFAIQTMLRERFGAVSMIEGDMSGRTENKPKEWEVELVKKQGWFITEATRPAPERHNELRLRPMSEEPEHDRELVWGLRAHTPDLVKLRWFNSGPKTGKWGFYNADALYGYRREEFKGWVSNADLLAALAEQAVPVKARKPTPEMLAQLPKAMQQMFATPHIIPGVGAVDFGVEATATQLIDAPVKEGV